MGQTISSRQTLFIALAALLAIIGIAEYSVLSFTHGVFSYPFDDAFIHLAIARNIAFHGVWGISPHNFTSASSSVLYPLLLAGCMKVFGASTALPLVLNLIAGILLLIVVHWWLIRQGLTPLAQLAVLLALIFLIPLPALMSFGMEHTMQTLVDFLFIYSFCGAIGNGQEKPSLPWYIYLSGALVTATRYEGVFIIGVACLMLVWNRKDPGHRVFTAVGLGLISALPIILFGIYSLSKGSYFIPNSVLVKSTAPPLSLQGVAHFLTSDIFRKPFYAHNSVGGVAIQRLILILPISYLLFIKALRELPGYLAVLVLLTVTCFLHLLFADTHILTRYEAYLIGCSIPILGVLLAKYGQEAWNNLIGFGRWMAVFVAFLLVVPIVNRSLVAFNIMTQGSINIYEQQYQMGQFVHRFYNATPVAMGDIGAISFFSQGKNVDLEGLGNLEIARSRKNGYWTPDFLYSLTQRDSVKVAIVFDASYPRQLLQQWKKVAIWQIPDNVACYSDVVSFYAVDSTEAPRLTANLQAFQPSLPRDVGVRYR